MNAQPEKHSYTSCSDADPDNRGYCARCTALTIEAHDRAIEALRWIKNRSQSVYGCTVQELGAKASEIVGE